MAMTRRHIIAATAALAATPALSPAAGSASAVSDLIDAHRAACEASSLAWGAVPDPEGAPTVRVLVGRILTGRTIGGEDTYQPRYAYDAASIECECAAHRDFGLVGAFDEKRKAIVEARHQERLARLLGELEQKQRELAEFEDRTGVTAAMNAARAASREADRCKVALLSYRPRNLAEAGQIAAYIALGLDEAEDFDGQDCEAFAVAFVRQLAGA